MRADRPKQRPCRRAVERDDRELPRGRPREQAGVAGQGPFGAGACRPQHARPAPARFRESRALRPGCTSIAASRALAAGLTRACGRIRARLAPDSADHSPSVARPNTVPSLMCTTSPTRMASAMHSKPKCPRPIRSSRTAMPTSSTATPRAPCASSPSTSRRWPHSSARASTTRSRSSVPRGSRPTDR
jgi:hypothetical protein